VRREVAVEQEVVDETATRLVPLLRGKAKRRIVFRTVKDLDVDLNVVVDGLLPHLASLVRT